MWEEKDNGQIIGLTLLDLQNHPYNDKPRHGRNGKHRYFCPVHGSDRQRSFQLNPETGHFKCFSCGIWGYIESINKHRFERQKKSPRFRRGTTKHQVTYHHNDYKKTLQELQQYLKRQDKDGIAVRYLKWRGITKETALRFGLGHAGMWMWPHKGQNGLLARQWKRGRLVFPHTDPNGKILNLYGRAIGAGDVPHKDRHDNLPGPKGAFNAIAMTAPEVFLCEGPFDALSLLEAGYPASAIFGIAGFNPDWVEAQEVTFCFDQDDAGGNWKYLAVELLRRGKRVFFLDPVAYEGHKDINELWMEKRRINIIQREIPPQGITG